MELILKMEQFQMCANYLDSLTQAAQQVSDQLYGMGGVCVCLPVPVVSALLTQSLFS